MLIGEVAQRTGVSARLLRYDESQGLLRPQRSADGYRRYGPADLTAVRHVRVLLAAGLGTATFAAGRAAREPRLPSPRAWPPTG